MKMGPTHDIRQHSERDYWLLEYKPAEPDKPGEPGTGTSAGLYIVFGLNEGYCTRMIAQTIPISPKNVRVYCTITYD